MESVRKQFKFLFVSDVKCSLNVDEQTFKLFVDEHLLRTNCRTILKEIYIILA